MNFKEIMERYQYVIPEIVTSKLTEAERLDSDLATLKEKVAILSRGITAVKILIENSRGVDGLHLNGDVAPWDSLLQGGQFEDWLIDFSRAERILEEA